MNNILEELYNGNIIPYEHSMPKCPEYQKLSNEMLLQSEEWKAKLTEEDFGKLEEFHMLLAELHDMELSMIFAYGFRMGALVMTEVFGGKEELVER